MLGILISEQINNKNHCLTKIHNYITRCTICGDILETKRSMKMAKKRILIVDDSMFMRNNIKRIIEQGGHIVIGEAANGHEAISQYEILNPDIVTLDVTMPVMDGLETVKKLKTLYPNANIIMCSAMGQQAMVLEAIQAGAKDFIVKPFTPERVLEAIAKQS